MPGPAGPSFIDDGQGDPPRLMLNGELRWWSDLSDEEKRRYRAGHPERYRDEASRPVLNESELDRARADLGLPSAEDDGTQGESDLLNALRGANIDESNQQVAGWLQYATQSLEAGDSTFEALLADIQMMSFNPELQKTNPYLEALRSAGFDGPYQPNALESAYGPGATAIREASAGAAPLQVPPAPRFEESEFGWIQFANGVLVSPDDEVIIDPTSDAPGGARWLRSINEWSAERIKSEKARLVEFGYLEKGAAKSAEITDTFRAALKAYHYSRYINGGTPLRSDAAGAGGAEAPKPVDLRDFQSQIRNDVRDQYERIYGVRPDDGEIELWSNYIMKQGMAMQRRNIRKYDSAMTESAAAEAEERFIEELENSPEAELLRESDEENTRMRDTFVRMAQVTDSLVS